MKAIGMTLGTLLLVSPAVGATDREHDVRKTVQAFYQAFDEGFVKPPDFATPDWYHINPLGGIDKGLDAVLKTVRDVHSTFLKGTTDTIDDMSVRFAADTVAVATVTSTMSPYTAPDGVKHGPEKHIRTFLVVRTDARWLSCRTRTLRSSQLHGEATSRRRATSIALGSRASCRSRRGM
jgi:uncharacterized protein (TIGR02246 family)